MSRLVGLDVGSYAVKLVSLVKKGHKFELEKLASAYNPAGQILPSDETRQAQLAAVIKSLMNENGLLGSGVFLSLPETEGFTSIVTMPTLTDAELSSAVQWEAEQHLPVALDTVNLEYAVIYRPQKGTGQKMTVLLVAAKKEVIEQTSRILAVAGIEPVGIETSLLAAGRALMDVNKQGVGVLCHFGALSTDILVVQNGRLALTHSVPIGGLAFTRAVERGLGLEPSQAEEYKRSYGLEAAQLEGRVRNVLLPVFNSVTAEIRKTMQFFEAQEQGNQVGSLVVSGGGAYLPGLVGYLAEVFPIEVRIGNPFENMEMVEGLVLPKEVASFAVATGLAMKEEE